MAEDFQGGVCNSTWWNLTKSPLGYWPTSTSSDWVMEMKSRSSDESGGSVSDQQLDSGGSLWMDSSTLQIMGMNGISSPSSTTSTDDWNHTLFGRRESNYNSTMVQKDMNSSPNFRQEAFVKGVDCPPQLQKGWTAVKNFCSGGGQDSAINGFNQTSQGLSLDDQASQGYPSVLLQTLFDSTDPQPQQSLFDNHSVSYSTGFSPPLAKSSPLPRPSQLPKEPPINDPLNLTNSVPLWHTSSESLNDIRTSLFPSTQWQFLGSTFEDKPGCPNLIPKPNNVAVQDLCSTGRKTTSEPAFKRPRIETPSPLPTFKVRKEKLGDRITALQQLVSPFGKTDTASVLQEAIEYIKFLHDQVNVLSTPYVKNGAPIHQHQQTCDKLKNTEGPKQDLRSRGLCLLPISSTYPVANETTVDFWTPTFGGTFR